MRRMVRVIAVSVIGSVALWGSRLVWSEEHEKDEKPLLDALSKSKHTLVGGIQQAAAKPPEAAISAKFELEDGKLSLSVYIGIPLDQQKAVFERFYRVDKARSRESGGAGLGLSIARWAVEAHGGRIELESEEGKGSRFRIVLPDREGELVRDRDIETAVSRPHVAREDPRI